MAIFVSTDAGKGFTKLGVFDGNKVSQHYYATKYSPGDFCDDALERNTFIAEVDGKVYKVGKGASKDAEMQLTKKSEIHRVTTLVSLAMATPAGSDEVTELSVVIGCPLLEYADPKKRKEYMDYILPDGDVSVKVKLKSDEEPEVRTFRIIEKKVLPETSGEFFLNIDEYDGEMVGFIDIGNGQMNGSVCDDYELDHEFDITTADGGNKLIKSLSDTLTTKYSNFNYKYTINLLKKPADERYLPLATEEEKMECKKFIHEHIIAYLNGIKEACRGKNWSLDYMKIYFSGGTALLIKDEIKEVFGENIAFSKYGFFSNCLGWLRRIVIKANPDTDILKYLN